MWSLDLNHVGKNRSLTSLLSCEHTTITNSWYSCCWRIDQVWFMYWEAPTITPSTQYLVPILRGWHPSPTRSKLPWLIRGEMSTSLLSQTTCGVGALGVYSPPPPRLPCTLAIHRRRDVSKRWDHEEREDRDTTVILCAHRLLYSLNHLIESQLIGFLLSVGD